MAYHIQNPFVFLNDAVDVAIDEDEVNGSLQPALTEDEYEDGDCQTSADVNLNSYSLCD